MGIASLVLGKPLRTRFRDQSDSADLMIVDVTVSIVPRRTVELTEMPVEEGDDITDHARSKPDEITIDGYVSESPLNLNSDIQGLVTSAGAVAGGAAAGGFGANLGAIGGGQIGARLLQSSTSPAEDARKKLDEMVDKKIIFTLYDKSKVYRDMIITSLTFPRDASTGRGLAFQATAKHIRIVKSQTVTIQNIKKGVAHSASKKQNTGTQSATPVEDTKKSSIAFKGFQALKGLVGGN